MKKRYSASRFFSSLLFTLMLILAFFLLFQLLRADLPEKSLVNYDKEQESLSFFGKRVSLPAPALEKLLAYPEESLAFCGEFLPQGIKNTAIRIAEVFRHGTAVFISTLSEYATRGY